MKMTIESYGKKMSIETDDDDVGIIEYIDMINVFLLSVGFHQETKCYCGHTTYCDCGPEEPKQETLEEAAKREYPFNDGFQVMDIDISEELQDKPQYENKTIDKLNKLMQQYEGTEQKQIITDRLEAFYKMNNNLKL